MGSPFSGSSGLFNIYGPRPFPAFATTRFTILTNGNVGIGTDFPASKLEIAGQDTIAMTGFQPFLTFKDSNAGNKRARIQSAGGDLDFYTDASLGGTAPFVVKNSTGFVVASGLGNEQAYMGGDGVGNEAQFGSLNPAVVNVAVYNAGSGQFMNLQVKTLTILSDRNKKENFAPVSARDTLAKVAALPITRWNYKDEPGTPHIGPVAQDFYAAFGMGADDQRIATVDEEGVALAAIQGLNQKLEEEASANQAKDAEIGELKDRLDRLERLLTNVGQH